MATAGARGSFIIAWDQSEIDGLRGAGPEMMEVGSSWRWSGDALRLGGPQGAARAGAPEDPVDRGAGLHRRAAGRLARLLGRMPAPGRFRAAAGEKEDEEAPLFRAGFELTDGTTTIPATLIGMHSGGRPMILFPERLPHPEREYWVLSCALGRAAAEGGTAEGADRFPAMPCFPSGTLIATPRGLRPVEDLGEGDQVCTRDGGPQPLRWVGRHRVSGGRLLAMPHLRPVRLAADAPPPGVQIGEAPVRDLRVSPDLRILIRSAAARALFGTGEVLVAARDLIDGCGARIDRSCRQVTYVQLMFERHQIIWANGIAAESTHPADIVPERFDPPRRQALLERFPDLAGDPFGCGGHARRVLSRAEAALLAHGLRQDPDRAGATRPPRPRAESSVPASRLQAAR